MHKLFAFAENPRVAICVLILLGMIMFLPGFFTMPPIDRDEARFAQASKQMIETGDYFDIHFQNDVRYKKPVGIYWLQAAGTRLLGMSPYNEIWTYRLPSLLAAVAALCLTYLLGRTLYSAPIGFGAALLLSCSIILAAEARLAKTDAILLAVTLLAMWELAKIYVKGHCNSPPGCGEVIKPHRGVIGERVIFWLAIAGGILIKGPIILMVVGFAILSLCILQKSPELFLQLRPVMGLLLTAVCIAPWLMAITLKSHGLFWQESIGHDMLGKVGGAQESHGHPFGTHTALLFVLFFPAAIAVARGLWHGWQARRERTTLFLLAWILPCWLIFEFVPTKLPHYTLPMIPAVAILAAAALAQVNFSDRRLRLAFALPIAMALGLNIGLLGLCAPSLPDFWIAPQIKHIVQDRAVIFCGYAEPSAVFLLGTPTQLTADGQEAVAAMQAQRSAVAAITTENTASFIAAAHKIHLHLRVIGAIRGFNVGRGKWQTLTLYEQDAK